MPEDARTGQVKIINSGHNSKSAVVCIDGHPITNCTGISVDLIVNEPPIVNIRLVPQSIDIDLSKAEINETRQDKAPKALPESLTGETNETDRY